MSKKSSAQARADRAAAALLEQRRRERRRTVLTVVAVVAVMVAIIGGGFLLGKRNGGGPTSAAADPGSGGVVVRIGKESAPHSVVIYEDFLCPYCGELEKQTHEKLAALADEGKVSVTYRPFRLLDPDYSQQSLEVFAATQHTAGDAVAKKLHDELYAQQPSETAASFPTQADLVALAVQAGADRTKVQQALDSGEATRWADASTKAATDAGVRSTPTVLLDGSEVTGRTVDDIGATLLQAVS